MTCIWKNTDDNLTVMGDERGIYFPMPDFRETTDMEEKAVQGECVEKPVDIHEFVSMLRKLTEEGNEVSMMVSGNSMTPFLVHHRDYIKFKKPEGDLHRGDMVFYRRKNGQYIMHRVWKCGPDGYYIIGDNQTDIEGPIAREQIFALITMVNRKGKWIGPGDFWWEFFAKVWIRMIPLRPVVRNLYTKIQKTRINQVLKNGMKYER